MAIAAKIDNDCMDVLQTATLTYDGSAGIISYAGVWMRWTPCRKSRPPKR